MRRLFIAVVIIVFLIGLVKCAKAQTEEVSSILKSQIDLEKDYNSILDYEETNICVEEDATNFSCTKSQPVVKYLYISDRTISFSETEDALAITKNTRTFTDPNGNRTIRVYGSDAFIEVDGTWYETEFGFATPELWAAANVENLTYLDKFNPFKVYKVNAQTYYAGSNDASCYRDNETSWGNARDAESADGCSTSATDGYIGQGEYAGSNNYIVSRAYLAFDTSALTCAVSSSTVGIYSDTTGDHTNGDSVVLLEGGLDSGSMNTSDWDLHKGHDAVSTEVTLQAFHAVENYKLFTITSTSTVDIDGYSSYELHSVNDRENLTPSERGYGYMYFAESSGTTKDPYLEVVCQEEGEEEPPEEEATTTIGFVYPDNMCINTDLSVVCGMRLHYESTTTEPDWVEYDYYHIPFIVWIIITIISLFIGDRILKEVLIRWRK